MNSSGLVVRLIASTSVEVQPQQEQDNEAIVIESEDESMTVGNASDHRSPSVQGINPDDKSMIVDDASNQTSPRSFSVRIRESEDEPTTVDDPSDQTHSSSSSESPEGPVSRGEESSCVPVKEEIDFNSAEAADFSSDDSHSSSDSSDKVEGSTPLTCIQQAQLSADESCIFTSDYSRAFSTYALPYVDPSAPSVTALRPYSQVQTSDPVWAFASNPLFNHRDYSTTHVLISRRDQHVALHNIFSNKSEDQNQRGPDSKPLDISHKLETYKLNDPLNEKFISPSSLAYTLDGTSFFAGSQNRLTRFDLRNNSNPIFSILTIPSARSKLKGGGVGFKGCISALSVSPSGGTLATGTNNGYIALYNVHTANRTTFFQLDNKTAEPNVSSVKWSPCSKYLYIAQRQSDTIKIYDERNTKTSVGYCSGRNALINLPLGFDVWSNDQSGDSMSHEIWAGGMDGKVKFWRDPYLQEGAVEPNEGIEVGDMPVTSTLIHSSGGVAITAGGRRELDNRSGHHGNRRGVLRRRPNFPKVWTWGFLDIFTLSSYESMQQDEQPQ